MSVINLWNGSPTLVSPLIFWLNACFGWFGDFKNFFLTGEKSENIAFTPTRILTVEIVEN